MQLLGIRSSVCPIHLLHTTAVGLLLWARQAGDIDRLWQLPGTTAAWAKQHGVQWLNAGSATLSSYIVAKHTCLLYV